MIPIRYVLLLGTEAQNTYLPFPMSHSYSKRKPEYKPRSPLLSLISMFEMIMP